MATFNTSTFLGGAGRWTIGPEISWSDARNATSADSTFATYEVESEKSGSNWFVERVFIPVDTSSIPTNATISAVQVDFTAYNTNSPTSITIHLIKTTQGNTSSRDLNDFNNVEFTSGGSVSINESSATAKTIAGNALSLDWIVKGGTSLLGIITDKDLADTAPTGSDGIIVLGSISLTVTYTTPAGAIVVTFI